MRLLVIEPAGNLWGSELALLDLLANLQGIEAAVCCPPGTAFEARIKSATARVLPYYVADLHKKSKLSRLWASLGILRACLKFRPDAIYLNQAGAYRTALPAAGLLGLSIFAHVRIFEDITYLAKQTPNPARLAGIIAISRAVEAAVRAQPKLSAIACHRLYDGYARTASGETQARAPNAIGCIGRIVPVKGHDILLGAMRILGHENPGAECMIAGSGDATYVAQLKSHSPPSVHWLGRIEKVIPLLETCAFLCCPSRAEPLGRVILEAWDAGAVPIVCRQSGGAAEIVERSGGGILFDEPTPASLAEALIAALALDSAGRQALVENGRGWMREHCDPRTYGRSLAAIFEPSRVMREHG